MSWMRFALVPCMVMAFPSTPRLPPLSQYRALPQPSEKEKLLLEALTNATDRPRDTFACVLDVALGAISLGQAIVSIDNAASHCSTDPTSNKVLCSADATEVLWSFLSLGGYIAAAAADCATEKNVGAACASAVQLTLSSIVEASQAAQELFYTCPPNQHKYSEMGFPWDGPDVFACVIDNAFAVFSAASVGIGLDAASAVDCREDGDKKLCVVDGFQIIGDLVFLGDYIADAVNDCAPDRDLDAACASDAMELVASLAMIGRYATLVNVHCSRT